MSRNNFILIFCFLIIGLPVFAQQNYQQFYNESLQNMNKGMYVLGSWAVVNIAVGAYGMSTQSGSTKYFHQMNLFWNTVNLGIAGFALINNSNPDVSLLSEQQMMQKHFNSEKLFLINAGLDLLYISGGAFMINRSKGNVKRPELLKGYGQSIILQGSFLLVFDAIMWGVQRNHRLAFMENLDISFNHINKVSELSLVYTF